MSTQSAIQKLQDELQRRFRVAGRGSVTRVQEELQLGGGYFRDLRRPERQRLDLRVLLGALDVLGVDTAEFFSSVFGSSDIVESFCTEAAELSRKLRRPPQILRQIEQRLEASPPDHPLDIDTLDHLDSLRRNNPREAMRQCRQLLVEADSAQLPRILGAYASACRVAGRLDEAQIVLAEALRMTTAPQDLAERAALIQRAAYILADRGLHEQAVEIVEKATLAYVKLGDTIGIGKTMIDQGVFAGYLERYEDSFNYFEKALGFLPENTTGALEVSRTSAQFNLAAVGLKLGRLEEAEHYANVARQAIACQGQVAVGKTIWLEATIAKAQDRRQDAIDFFEKALEIFRDLEPLTAAVVAVDLVRWQLQIGHAVEAYATAKAMISLIKPLESNRFAAAAITDMARSALAGQGLTEAFLDQVVSDLQGARKPKKAKKH